MSRLSLRDRFLARSVLLPSGCVEWQGVTARGYGQISHNGVMIYAHRLAYEMFVGDIPEGAEILHSCDNPPCVNPARLSVGDRADNDLVHHKKRSAI